MNIILNKKENGNLKENEVLIELQYSNKNLNLQSLINYISNYELNCQNKVIVLNDSYELLEIKSEDIIMFYSDKKFNYCKTKNEYYKIRSKLYELEKANKNFIRISKSCIVNMKHIEKFDISETGKIVVKLDDCTEQVVSRRKTGNIMKYLDDRRI
ncbi:MAG: LytTR family transcriptional regulator [Clostridia bacterium]|nr:LytTR family transcriptional regulator [Clostridia bacterium]